MSDNDLKEELARTTRLLEKYKETVKEYHKYTERLLFELAKATEENNGLHDELLVTKNVILEIRTIADRLRKGYNQAIELILMYRAYFDESTSEPDVIADIENITYPLGDDDDDYEEEEEDEEDEDDDEFGLGLDNKFRDPGGEDTND